MAITVNTTSTVISTLRGKLIKTLAAAEAELLVRNPALLDELNAEVAALLKYVDDNTLNSGTITTVETGKALTGVTPSGTFATTVTFTVANGAITAIALS